MGGAMQPAQGKLGKRLRKYRTHHGLTQMDVARSTLLDQTTISAIERGRGDRASQEIVKMWLDTAKDEFTAVVPPGKPMTITIKVDHG